MAVTTRIRRPEPRANNTGRDPDGTARLVHRCQSCESVHQIEVTPEDLLNAPCLVDTADGQRLFKRLRRGYTPGRYNLESWDGSPIIEDVEVLNVLPFAALTPGRKAR